MAYGELYFLQFFCLCDEFLAQFFLVIQEANKRVGDVQILVCMLKSNHLQRRSCFLCFCCLICIHEQQKIKLWPKFYGYVYFTMERDENLQFFIFILNKGGSCFPVFFELTIFFCCYLLLFFLRKIFRHWENCNTNFFQTPKYTYRHLYNCTIQKKFQ